MKELLLLQSSTSVDTCLWNHRDLSRILQCTSVCWNVEWLVDWAMAPVWRHPEKIRFYLTRCSICFTSKTIIWYCPPPPTRHSQNAWVKTSRKWSWEWIVSLLLPVAHYRNFCFLSLWLSCIGLKVLFSKWKNVSTRRPKKMVQLHWKMTLLCGHFSRRMPLNQ